MLKPVVDQKRNVLVQNMQRKTYKYMKKCIQNYVVSLHN